MTTPRRTMQKVSSDKEFYALPEGIHKEISMYLFEDYVGDAFARLTKIEEEHLQGEELLSEWASATTSLKSAAHFHAALVSDPNVDNEHYEAVYSFFMVWGKVLSKRFARVTKSRREELLAEYNHTVSERGSLGRVSQAGRGQVWNPVTRDLTKES